MHPRYILVDEDATDGDAKDEDATNQDVISLSFYYERFSNKKLVQNPQFFFYLDDHECKSGFHMVETSVRLLTRESPTHHHVWRLPFRL